MDSEPSVLIAQHARRGLRWQVFGLFASLTTAVLAALTARTNSLSGILVAVCGIGCVFGARSLRAAGSLLQLVQPPSPRWISRLVPVAFVVGPLTSAIGLAAVPAFASGSLTNADAVKAAIELFAIAPQTLI